MHAGIVHWQPPPGALAAAAAMANDPAVSAYGPDEGLPALREALRKKVQEENGLQGVSQGCEPRSAARWGGSGRAAGPCPASRRA